MITDTASKTAAVVYNPTKVDIATRHAAISAEATAAGWAETSRYETSVGDVGQNVTTRALGAGADLTTAAGGD